MLGSINAWSRNKPDANINIKVKKTLLTKKRSLLYKRIKRK